MNLTVKVFIVVGGVACSFFVVVWMRTLVIQSGYEVTELKEKVRTLDFELALVEVEWAKIQSYQTIALKAREQGYQRPGEYDVAERFRLIRANP